VYAGAPSGDSTASVTHEPFEELSATSSLTLHDLQVRLVTPSSSTADPVPAAASGGPVQMLIEFIAADGGTIGCHISAGASTCSSPTIDTIPAGSLLLIDLVVTTGGSPGLVPGYTPDVIFNYQVTASS
jgi:hypothetical protein